ncbi:MAG: hypothetical protein U7127_20560 [Phormidium sp.]
MTLEQTDLAEDLELEVEDILSNITSDLVADRSNSPFLERLFSIDAGKWVELEPLCQELKQIEKQFAELKTEFNATIKVTWLDYPVSACGEGFCTILFFVESLHWSNLALYNQNHLMKYIDDVT